MEEEIGSGGGGEGGGACGAGRSREVVVIGRGCGGGSDIRSGTILWNNFGSLRSGRPASFDLEFFGNKSLTCAGEKMIPMEVRLMEVFAFKVVVSSFLCDIVLFSSSSVLFSPSSILFSSSSVLFSLSSVQFSSSSLQRHCRCFIMVLIT